MKNKHRNIKILVRLIIALLFVTHFTDAKSAAVVRESGNFITACSKRLADTLPVPATKRADDLTKTMNCEIGLLGSQIHKVYEINLEACLKMDTATMESKNNIRLLQKKGKIIDEERNVKLRDVLTPKQFADYERISKGNLRALRKTAVCRDISQTW